MQSCISVGGRSRFTTLLYSTDVKDPRRLTGYQRQDTTSFPDIIYQFGDRIRFSKAVHSSSELSSLVVATWFFTSMSEFKILKHGPGYSTDIYCIVYVCTYII
ncbi:hypothetical protein KQX54_003799 [Cotesia glomerata]|uniref:Uncharacterized protein n=1 Tax=Cotesia glomerata TaxID=32391 RepID=A0AAV7I8Y4_COTGL|nr:hypothetical protein KQX54_003799 [Cotesia glomerata]